MANCELCGAERNLTPALIEGVHMNVCSSCAKHGQIIIKPTFKPKTRKIREREEEEIVDNYAEIIRKKRESLRLTQEEFSKKVSEKLSLMHKIETKKAKPSIGLARKLERMLKIRLVQKYEPTKKHFSSESAEGFTIGDFIKK